MKLFAGIVVLASCMPYVCGNLAAAAAATSRDGVAAAAATTTSREAERPPMRCNCPFNYAPVCGTDGVTYTNECWLTCATHRCIKDKVPTIGLAYRAACSALPCRCPNSVIPVCGTDGKTYRNACILRYYSSLNNAQSPIFVAEPGPCRIEKCICSKEREEICASDKKTYYNRCFLNCQNRRLGQLAEKLLTIKHSGSCAQCGCPKIRDPVCAYNDVTFDNECLFVCENNKRIEARQKKLLMRWNGADCNCGCTNEWDPYCTPCGRTFPNLCLLRCENRKLCQDGRAELTATRGVCKRCRCDYCPLVEQPVRDNEGKIHRNICFFNCNNDCREKAGLVKLYIDNKYC